MQAIVSMEKFEEFAELDDQGRRDTFEKFVKRQKVSDCWRDVIRPVSS